MSSLQDTSQDDSSQDEAAQQRHGDDEVASVRSVLQQNETDRRRQQQKRKREAAAAAAREAGGLPGSAGVNAPHGSNAGGRPRLAGQRSPNERMPQSFGGSRGAGAAGSREASEQVGGRRHPVAALPRLVEIDRPRDRRVAASRHAQSQYSHVCCSDTCAARYDTRKSQRILRTMWQSGGLPTTCVNCAADQSPTLRAALSCHARHAQLAAATLLYRRHS